MKVLKALVLGLAVVIGSPTGWLAAAAQSGPSITLAPTTGPPNTLVAFTGSGFPPNEIVGLYLDTPDTFIGSPGPRADAQGNFTESDAMPGGTPGRHQVCADTSKPTAQPVAAKACTSFEMLALPSTTPAVIQQSTPSGAPLAIVFLLIGIVIGVGIGAVLWSRR